VDEKTIQAIESLAWWWLLQKEAGKPPTIPEILLKLSQTWPNATPAAPPTMRYTPEDGGKFEPAQFPLEPSSTPKSMQGLARERIVVYDPAKTGVTISKSYDPGPSKGAGIPKSVREIRPDVVGRIEIPADEWIPVATAARLMGFATQTIRQWAEEELIPSRFESNQWHIHRDSFKEMVSLVVRQPADRKSSAKWVARNLRLNKYGHVKRIDPTTGKRPERGFIKSHNTR
jgi:hypothetical protein